jgi:hypothetical protein
MAGGLYRGRPLEHVLSQLKGLVLALRGDLRGVEKVGS